MVLTDKFNITKTSKGKEIIKQDSKNELSASSVKSNSSISVNPYEKFKIVEMSDCWSKLLTTQNQSNKNNTGIIEEIFYNNLIPKETFFTDPWKVFNNQNLVVRVENTLYNWKAAAPLIMSIVTYGELPPKS